jgi:hypothetical protein
LGEVGEFFEGVRCEAEVTAILALLYAFTEDGAGVPVEVLIEFDGYEVVFVDELTDVRDLEVDALLGEELLGDVLDDAGETELSGIFGHVGVGGDFDEVHLGDGDVPGGAH